MYISRFFVLVKLFFKKTRLLKDFQKLYRGGGGAGACITGLLKREIDGAVKPVARIDVSIPSTINVTHNNEDKK